jgi:uncharacterized hydrophobic protein (TIGR00271 family)
MFENAIYGLVGSVIGILVYCLIKKPFFDNAFVIGGADAIKPPVTMPKPYLIACVIIGAMLISPIMGSILASAYGSVSADYPLLKNHMVGFGLQIAISVAAATIYFLLSPVKDPTVELLARTSPTFFDVLIAFFGGLAGIIGQTRIDKTNTVIPGVAIATALMPPLCTCGYSIANGRWDMLLGAGYLFILNAYFIFLSASIILSALKIPKTKELTEKQWRRHRLRMVRNTIIIAIPSIIAVYSMI